ncbi:MAG: hypothetical protein ACTHJ4_06055 [Candidatus Nucleicultricaceae bacterium]
MATATATQIINNFNEGPKIDFVVNATGMTIFSSYFNTPRFVPWDLPGRCTRCKSTTVEVDYVLQPNGVTIICTRLKQQIYLPFDEGAKWSDGSRIRIRSRNKVLTIPLQMEGMLQSNGTQFFKTLLFKF